MASVKASGSYCLTSVPDRAHRCNDWQNRQRTKSMAPGGLYYSSKWPLEAADYIAVQTQNIIRK